MKIGEYREKWLKEKRQESMKLWIKIVKDFDNGLSPEVIAKKYFNPKTQKPYTRAHIYWVLNTLKKNVKIDN